MMNPDAEQFQIRAAIDNLVCAKERLSALRVIRSERLVGEIGEWLFTAIYGGTRATSSSQKGWDVKLDEKRVQVKTHAKGDKNNARWTELNYDNNAFDEIAILVFTRTFHLKEFYRAPSVTVMQRAENSGKQKIVKWDKLKDCRIDLDKLPHQEIVALYMK